MNSCWEHSPINIYSVTTNLNKFLINNNNLIDFIEHKKSAQGGKKGAIVREAMEPKILKFVLSIYTYIDLYIHYYKYQLFFRYINKALGEVTEINNNKFGIKNQQGLNHILQQPRQEIS
jgi:hypothetical protein